MARFARTDAHRPSAINPSDYDFVACDYFGAWAFQSFEHERKAFRAHMERTGGKFAQRHNTGTCHICGAAALYVARYHHVPSNTYITTGMDCAEKMDFGGTETFKRFRAQVSHARKVNKGKAVAKEMLALMGLSDCYRVWDGTLPAVQEIGGWNVNVVREIVAKLIRWGSISEKQMNLLAKLLAEIYDAPRREAERAARIKAEKAASNWIGTKGERVEMELTVAFTTSFETQFGIMHVHSMRDAAGNVVVYKGNRIAEKGQRIKIKATIKEHGTYKDMRQTIVARPKVEAVL